MRETINNHNTSRRADICPAAGWTMRPNARGIMAALCCFRTLHRVMAGARRRSRGRPGSGLVPSRAGLKSVATYTWRLEMATAQDKQTNATAPVGRPGSALRPASPSFPLALRYPQSDRQPTAAWRVLARAPRRAPAPPGRGISRSAPRRRAARGGSRAPRPPAA